MHDVNRPGAILEYGSCGLSLISVMIVKGRKDALSPKISGNGQKLCLFYNCETFLILCNAVELVRISFRAINVFVALDVLVANVVC